MDGNRLSGCGGRSASAALPAATVPLLGHAEYPSADALRHSHPCSLPADERGCTGQGLAQCEDHAHDDNQANDQRFNETVGHVRALVM